MIQATAVPDAVFAWHGDESEPRPGVEPLDWQSTPTPRRWRIGSKERAYRWERPWGADLRPDGV